MRRLKMKMRTKMRKKVKSTKTTKTTKTMTTRQHQHQHQHQHPAPLPCLPLTPRLPTAPALASTTPPASLLCPPLSGDTQFHLGPLALFCKYVVLGSTSICDFSVNMSCLEPLPSATIFVNMLPLEVFPLALFINILMLETPSICNHFCKYIALGSVSICDLFLYYLLIVPRLNRLTHLFIVPLYLFTSINSVL